MPATGCSMTSADRARLVAILGRLGSEFDGERAAAGLMASRMMRSAGLTWDDVVLPPPAEPEPPHQSSARGYVWPSNRAEALAECDRNADLLTRWEEGFLAGIAARPVLSVKQMETLMNIACDVQRRAAK